MVIKGFSTKAVHAGELIDKRFGNVITPIFLSSTYLSPNESQEKYIDPTRNKPYLYTRLGNPTFTSFEQKYAALENASYALSFSSGMAAITTSIMSAVKQGERILALNQLYGQTYEFFKEVSTNLGIQVDFVSVDSLNALEIPAKEYKVFYVESITNPTMQVCDIKTVAEYCIEKGIDLFVDATFASPYLQRPLDFGASVVLHSATKYIGGHSDLIMGLFATNSKSIYEKVVEYRSTLGCIPEPFSVYLALRGIKTLALRMERQQSNAMKLAKFLSQNEKVSKVNYPGLENNEYHDLAKKVLNGFGAMLSFELKGGYEAAKKFIRALKLCIVAPSLGGVETLVTLPLETSHRQLSIEERMRMNINEGLIRVSVGIEDYEDIEKDFSQALEAVS
ncbi:MAG TPA: aminotransferase class I/II-fold pyridoxal phosphate-dependent enzyme [Geobacterales bacterium]|nr:aminotransferase class I/II-fold pyridoxal phosphate-dependent enzyme [Geobacterales bacterium]